MILALIWQMVRYFALENAQDGGGDGGGGGKKGEKAVELMVEWAGRMAGGVGVKVMNLTSCFEGGLVFGGVMKGVSESFPWDDVVVEDVGPAGEFFFCLFVCF